MRLRLWIRHSRRGESIDSKFKRRISMTKRNSFFSGLVLFLPLALASVLVLHPTRAKGEAAGSALEIQIDNFSFGPATLTVPVNSVVTWVNKDDLPHVI